MTLNTLLLSFILTLITSCHGQNVSNVDKKTVNSNDKVGSVVKALPANIWYIYQDKKDNYWYGSDGNGVFRYDGKTIQNFTTKDGLSSDSIRQIKEDKSGNMYFTTISGINKYDGTSITTLQPIESTEWKMEDDDLWFHMLGKKYENGPYRFDGKNLYHLAFPKHYLHDEMHKRGINTFFSPYEVYSIYKDRKGAMWFGTSVFGACRFDGKSIKWMYEEDLTIVPNGGSFGIRSIYEDKEGSFWLCNTWHRFLMDGDATAKSNRLQYTKTKGIGDASIFGGEEYIYYSHILEDNQGNIWLTTYSKGVYKYDGKTITNYPVKNGAEIIHLVSMYKDNQGVLWLGTPENGVYKFNGKTFERFRP